MSAVKLEQAAMRFLSELESKGKQVTRIVIEGKRIEFDLAGSDKLDEFERIDMRHGKT